ncbi:MAG: MFS transporter, partial [Acetobacteraceae bacterium]
AQPAAIVPAAIVGSFGRGANGAAGPFSPVEQAWLSAGLRPSEYGSVYSFNAAVGFCGMAIGSGFAALPAVWHSALPGALAYRPLFVLVLIGSLAPLAMLLRMQDTKGPIGGPIGPRKEIAEAKPTKPADRRRERGLLLRLVGINALNGLGIGIIGPFMAFWFALKFGVGPASIAPVLAAGFLLAMLSSLGTGRLTRRLGMVRSVVVMRTAGLVLLVLLPFAPTYTLAAICYVLRSACNRGTAGARQAVGLRLVGAERRGLAASLNTSSMQIPRALGPTLGGLLLDSHMLALPLLLAAALQGAYIAFYRVAFRSVE